MRVRVRERTRKSSSAITTTLILLWTLYPTYSCAFISLHQSKKPAFTSVLLAVDGSSDSPQQQRLPGSDNIPTKSRAKQKMNLIWCQDECKDVMREKLFGSGNQIVLKGSATGQVAYYWDDKKESEERSNGLYSKSTSRNKKSRNKDNASVFLLIKSGDDELMTTAAGVVQELLAICTHLDILLEPTAAARLKHYHGVDGDRIHLYEAIPAVGFGEKLRPAEEFDSVWYNSDTPDIICTLGGDGLLMHAGMMFQGPVPPIMCVAGGSLGFLTPFSIEEMVFALLISLGETKGDQTESPQTPEFMADINVFPPNMPAFALEENTVNGQERKNARFSFSADSRICLSIRMRLECCIFSQDGAIRARYNVLNEVVVDRGSSPYLAALECFCDNVHLTTVQADGVIFATPTGSTAYSLSAGSSVVHPAVPCILVTPICPHVLSFRPMIFPDHVVLRCYVPEDARSEASVAFDGKHRQELRRGESLQVQMSPYPVPTINRVDHSADWLESLKRSFNFNSRPRQRPL
jgi:NAD+ kinase